MAPHAKKHSYADRAVYNNKRVIIFSTMRFFCRPVYRILLVLSVLQVSFKITMKINNGISLVNSSHVKKK